MYGLLDHPVHNGRQVHS